MKYLSGPTIKQTCMIKGHDSIEEESAVLGACNLVSLFFLETVGQAGGQATDGYDGVQRLLGSSQSK